MGWKILGVQRFARKILDLRFGIALSKERPSKVKNGFEIRGTKMAMDKNGNEDLGSGISSEGAERKILRLQFVPWQNAIKKNRYF